MLLMLVAFSSIILGLAVTFYYYCTRSLELGNEITQFANQRLAFRAAINYLSLVNPMTGHRVYAYASLYTPNAVRMDLNGPSNKSDAAGYFRIRNSPIGSDIVSVTVGIGLSNGYQCWNASTEPPNWTTDKWRTEKRSWYRFVLGTQAYAMDITTIPTPAAVRSISLDATYGGLAAW